MMMRLSLAITGGSSECSDDTRFTTAYATKCSNPNTNWWWRWFHDARVACLPQPTDYSINWLCCSFSLLLGSAVKYAVALIFFCKRRKKCQHIFWRQPSKKPKKPPRSQLQKIFAIPIPAMLCVGTQYDCPWLPLLTHHPWYLDPNLLLPTHNTGPLRTV